MPFGIAVDIDKSTGYKQLIQHFSRLRFSITPDKLYRFKQSAIEDSKSEVENHEETANGFKQWVADNVDHNIATLTGKRTFHGMGIICVEKKQVGSFGKVPRLKNRLPVATFAGSCGIEIVPYQKSSQIRKFRFEPIFAVTATSLNSDPSITIPAGFYHQLKNLVQTGLDSYSPQQINFHKNDLNHLLGFCRFKISILLTSHAYIRHYFS